MKTIAYKIFAEALVLFLVGASGYLVAEMILPGFLSSRIGIGWIFIGFALTVFPMHIIGRGVSVSGLERRPSRRASVALVATVAAIAALLAIRDVPSVVWVSGFVAMISSMTAVVVILVGSGADRRASE